MPELQSEIADWMAGTSSIEVEPAAFGVQTASPALVALDGRQVVSPAWSVKSKRDVVRDL